jgi:hypothetical protein
VLFWFTPEIAVAGEGKDAKFLVVLKEERRNDVSIKNRYRKKWDGYWTRFRCVGLMKRVGERDRSCVFQNLYWINALWPHEDLDTFSLVACVAWRLWKAFLD